jgi:hypothetical protein
MEPTLTIDPCVAIDEPLVRKLMALELRDARARNLNVPDSVTVGCVGDKQEIRMEPWASTAPEGVRTIELPPLSSDAGPREVQARSRELALAIAEFVRRFESAHPSPPEEEEPTPPPPPPPPPPVVEAPAPPQPTVWELGLLSRLEHFSGGQNLAGADLFTNTRLRGWLLIEANLGARWARDLPAAQGQLHTRAGTAGFAIGLHRLWRDGALGAAMVFRAQGYLAEFRAEAPAAGSTQTAVRTGYVLAAEPRLTIAVTRNLWLEASVALGGTPRGVVVKVRAVETTRMSGMFLSGGLGCGWAF